MERVISLINKFKRNEKGSTIVEFLIVLAVFSVVLVSTRYFFMYFMYGAKEDNTVGFAERAILNSSQGVNDSDNPYVDGDEAESFLNLTDGLHPSCVEIAPEHYACN